MEKVLVSLCFFGEPCRYHGRSVGSPSKIARLKSKYELIPACPEQLGGMPTPRPAAPLSKKRGNQISNIKGEDVSLGFVSGAQEALRICQENDIRRAYLCKGSPSCDKKGFTGELLLANGILVINL